MTDDDTKQSAMIRATAGLPELSNRFDKEWEKGGPIPRGNYEILNRVMEGMRDGNGKLLNVLDQLQENYGAWALDRIDPNPRDDRAEGGRGLFRLHPFGSTGCVVTDNLKDFAKVAAILNGTKTKTVKDLKNRTRTYYGTMWVVSAPRARDISEQNDHLIGPKTTNIWDLLFRGRADPKIENR